MRVITTNLLNRFWKYGVKPIISDLNKLKQKIDNFPSSLPASDVHPWAKAETKPDYGWNEIGDKPSTYPPAGHTHNRIQIVDFPSSLPASDVHPWAKAETKPGYGWNEIGDKPSTYPPAGHTHNRTQIVDFPSSLPASDVHPWAKAETKPGYGWNEIGDKPSTYPPAGHTHDDIYYTKSEIQTAINRITNVLPDIRIYIANVSAASGTITIPANNGVLCVQNAAASISNDAVTSWQSTGDTTLYYNKSGSASTRLAIVYIVFDRHIDV